MTDADHETLQGQRILVTRPKAQAAELVDALAALGAQVLEAPAIVIEPLDDYAEVDDALGKIESFDWLVLTSFNGVDALAGRLRALGMDGRLLSGVKLAAVGPATAGRLSHVLRPADLTPDTYDSESLAAALRGSGLSGKRCLLLRSAEADQRLPDLLEREGAACADVPIYRIARAAALPARTLELLEAGQVNWITFTSASAVRGFVGLLGESAAAILPRLKLAAIGPATGLAIRKAGYRPTVQAVKHTASGLIEAIIAAA